MSSVNIFSLSRSGLLVASLAFVVSFGTASASDKFGTEADSRQIKSEQQIFNLSSSTAPKSVRATGGAGFSAGVTSASDQSQSAVGAINKEAEKVRRQATDQIKSVQREMTGYAEKGTYRVTTSGGHCVKYESGNNKPGDVKRCRTYAPVKYSVKIR